MRQDPVTGALMTDEQAAASDASVKEGLFARFEGRIQQIHERLGKNEEAAAAEKARLDALAQGQKQVEQGALDKVVAHFQEREQNLVLVTTELRADHDLLQKNFEALVAQINGNSPGFYNLLKAPAPPAKDKDKREEDDKGSDKDAEKAKAAHPSGPSEPELTARQRAQQTDADRRQQQHESDPAAHQRRQREQGERP